MLSKDCLRCGKKDVRNVEMAKNGQNGTKMEALVWSRTFNGRIFNLFFSKSASAISGQTDTERDYRVSNADRVRGTIGSVRKDTTV